MENCVPNTFPALFAAYTAVWVLVMGYVFYMGRKLSSLERRLKETEGDSSSH